MSDSKYVELVKKFEKEGKDTSSLAAKNAPILKAKLDAKIQALKAQEMEVNSELLEAKEGVSRAVAMVTTDVDAWIRNVRKAEEVEAQLALKLKTIHDSMQWHQDATKYF